MVTSIVPPGEASADVAHKAAAHAASGAESAADRLKGAAAAASAAAAGLAGRAKEAVKDVASSSAGGQVKAAQQMQMADQARQQQQQQVVDDDEEAAGLLRTAAAGAQAVFSKAEEAVASAKQAVAGVVDSAGQTLQEQVVQPTQDWAGTLQAQQQQRAATASDKAPTTASAAIRAAEQQRLQYEKERSGVLNHLQQLPHGTLQFARSVADEISAAAGDVAGLARGAARQAPSHAAGAAGGVASWLTGSDDDAAAAAAEAPAAGGSRAHVPGKGAVDAARGAVRHVREAAKVAVGKARELGQQQTAQVRCFHNPPAHFKPTTQKLFHNPPAHFKPTIRFSITQALPCCVLLACRHTIGASLHT
jgi:hypothetical protein